ncbi:MAG TPA: arginase family protein [Candidatus Polarisedimenticolia bacterium]|nr:arginase family protein [Candidatus Polarisedimenticolia bacterium]
MNLTILGVPSSIGARSLGTEKAPAALRKAGLLERLQACGHDVHDGGDQEPSAYRPDEDPAHRKLKNLASVIRVIQSLAPRVESALRQGRVPVVLGGDCTIALGSVSGAVQALGEMGLAYLDRDAELNTPRTTPSGILDGMVIAHLLGRGEPTLSRLDGGEPLLRPGKLALLGVERLDPQEIPFYEALPSLRVPGHDMRRMGPDQVAQEVLARLASGKGRFWIHCDLDVLDEGEMPAVDFPAPGGIGSMEMRILLSRLVAHEGFAGIEVTNFNPDKDPDGQVASRVVGLLVEALAPEANVA